MKTPVQGFQYLKKSDFLQNNLQKTLKCLNENIVVFNSGRSPVFTFLTGINSSFFSGAILLAEKGNSTATIFCSKLEEKWMKKNTGFIVKSINCVSKLKKELSSKTKNKTVYANLSEINCKTKKFLLKLKPASIKNIETKLNKIRCVKSKEEIKKIRKAVKITESVLNNLKELLNKNDTEKTLSSKIRFEAECLGSDLETAFQPIVAFSKNSSNIHHFSGNTKIRKGLLLVDFGAKYKNYCADLTRCYFVGKTNKKILEEYEKVFQAKKLAESLVRKGENSKKVFLRVCSFLGGKKWRMQHSLGHGIGIEVHDFPKKIAETNSFAFKQNNVLAIEPGIYNKTFGIRVEDCLIVKKNKSKTISSANSQPEIIKN